MTTKLELAANKLAIVLEEALATATEEELGQGVFCKLGPDELAPLRPALVETAKMLLFIEAEQDQD